MNEIAPTQSSALLGFIERAARDPDFDLAKFGALLSMQKELQAEQAKRAFNGAMAIVQNEIEGIVATGRNPTFNNPYAKLEDLDREARPVYTRHGFSVRYGSALADKAVPPPAPGELRVVLIISHADGYSEEHHLDGPKDVQTGARGRTGIQAVGSTVKYLRRYLLQMVLNLVPAQDPDDDDGEAARRERAPAPPPRQETPPRQTVSQWLDELEAELGGCEATEEVDAIVGREQVQKASAQLKNEAAARLNKMVRDAYDRLTTAQAEMHDDEMTLPE